MSRNTSWGYICLRPALQLFLMLKQITVHSTALWRSSRVVPPPQRRRVLPRQSKMIQAVTAAAEVSCSCRTGSKKEGCEGKNHDRCMGRKIRGEDVRVHILPRVRRHGIATVRTCRSTLMQALLSNKRSPYSISRELERGNLRE